MWCKLVCENIATPLAPALKVYYWEYCDIDNLNSKLSGCARVINHSLRLPACDVNSSQLKIVLWLRNQSAKSVCLRLKRIQNCPCLPVETRVGFNRFAQRYQCPHRKLVCISKDLIELRPSQLAELCVCVNFLVYGQHVATYRISVSDSRIINLNFHLDITVFAPQKCLLNCTLIPGDIKNVHRFVQPLWVCNTSKRPRTFHFSTREYGCKILNPTMVVPGESVWPLMVKYLPDELKNEFDLYVDCGKISGQMKLSCDAELEPKICETELPLRDYRCSDVPYIVYPNKLDFRLQQNEQRSLLMSVQNLDHICLEFKWQNYYIQDLFEVTFEPSQFILQPNHFRYSVAVAKSFQCPLHFQRIPLVLEIHRIDDLATRVAKAEIGGECESIDDPEWCRGTYWKFILVQLNVKVDFPCCETLTIVGCPCVTVVENSKEITIFEKFFWSYMAETAYKSCLVDCLNSEEVLQVHKVRGGYNKAKPATSIREIRRVMEQIIEDSLKCITRFMKVDLKEIVV